ncbi:MAG: Hsp20/alpha crystallin family protein [Promethearchaeota archaeon]
MCFEPDSHSREKNGFNWHHHRSPPPPPPFSHFFGKGLSELIGGLMFHVGECMEWFKGWIPHDIEEAEGYYVIKVPLPGFTKEDVQVSLINGNINITASKPYEESGEEWKTKEQEKIPRIFRGLMDFWERPINVDIPLPADANPESIKSVLKNGLLKIKIDKKPPKKIDVTSDDES